MINRLLPKLPGTLVDDAFEPVAFEFPERPASQPPTAQPSQPKRKVRIPVDARYTIDDTGQTIIDPRYPYRYVEVDEGAPRPDLSPKRAQPDLDPTTAPVGWAMSKLPEGAQKALALPGLIAALPEMAFEASRAKQAELAPDTLGKPIEEVDAASVPATMLAKTASHLYTLPWAMAEGVGHAVQSGFQTQRDYLAGAPVNQKSLNQAAFDLASMAPLGVGAAKTTSSIVGQAADTGDLGVFAGRSAARNLESAGRPGARLALDLADELERSGFTPDEIAASATAALQQSDPALGGVSKGVDGKWRFEIDDSQSRFAPGYDLARGRHEQLPDMFDHPDYFTAYPDMREGYGNATLAKELGGEFSYDAVNPQTNKSVPLIEAQAPTAKDARSVILHELQHGAQVAEKFASGASPDMFKQGPEIRRAYTAPMVEDIAEYNYSTPFTELPKFTQQRVLDVATDALYRNSAGEVEARNVQSRMDMTPEQRRAIAPSATQDRPAGQQVIIDPEMLARDFPDDPASARIFAGRNAATADAEALARAEELERSGAPREEVWNETGWFRGVDGQWRFEIDDSNASLAMFKRSGILPEVMKHPDFYNAYPRLRETRVMPMGGAEGSAYAGGFTPGQNRLFGLWKSPGRISHSVLTEALGGQDALKSTMLHEMQHAVENREGFARGGNYNTANEYFTPEQREVMIADAVEERMPVLINQWRRGQFDSEGNYVPLWRGGRPKKNSGRLTAAIRGHLERVAREDVMRTFDEDVYRRLAGEVEARNVEERRQLTAEQRRALPPWETQDIPDDYQIVLDQNAKPNILDNKEGGFYANPDEAGIVAAGLAAGKREIDARGFYSPSLEAAKALKQNTGTVQQMKAQLLKAGAKPKELDAVGFDKAFPDPNAKVTRQEIEDFLRKNRVELGETRYGDRRSAPVSSVPEEVRAALREMDNLGFSSHQQAWAAIREHPDWMERWDVDPSRGGPDKVVYDYLQDNPIFPTDVTGPSRYESYSTPGGIPGSYRENVTTLRGAPRDQIAPSDAAAAPYKAEWDRLNKEIDEASTIHNDIVMERNGQTFTYEGQAKAKEHLERLLNEREALHGKMVDAEIERQPAWVPRDQYTSDHWKGVTNPLLHYRTKDFEGPRGIQAYHWTQSETPIESFDPLSHFGTREASNQRFEERYGQVAGATYPVDLNIKNPLRIEDNGLFDYNDVAIAIDKATGSKIFDEIYAGSMGYDEALPIIQRELERRGYDGLVYRNTVEDAGSDSYIATRPETVRNAGAQKTRLLDELQSDWGQRARDRGIRDPETVAKAEAAMEAAVSRRDAAEKALDDMARQIPGFSPRHDAQAQLSNFLRDPSTAPEVKAQGNKLFEDYLSAKNEAMDLGNKWNAIRDGGVPSAPFISNTSDWVDLGLKQTLIDAARDPSVNRLAWTPGDVQAQRYGMEQHIEGVSFAPIGNSGEAYLSTRVPGSQSWAGVRKIKIEELPDYVGSELAERLKAAPLQEDPSNGFRQAHVLTGEDLRVGGEGHKKFYGTMSPEGYQSGIVGTRLSKLVKGLDPEAAKIEGTGIPTRKSVSYGDARDWSSMDLPTVPGDSVQYPSISITPALRKKILEEGLSLFANKEDLAAVSAIVAAAERESANPTVRAAQKRAADVPFEDKLAVQHNMRGTSFAHNMRSYDGNIPVPSLAISKAGQPLTNFGDISLFGDPSMAIPKGSNPIYPADAYTKRSPKIVRDVPKSADRDRMVEKLTGQKGKGYTFNLDDPYWDTNFRVGYLRSKGVTPPDGVDLDFWARNAIGYGERDAMEAFVNDFLDSHRGLIRERIDQGYDDNGYRRYKPHTLDNMVKASKGKAGSEDFDYGPNAWRAHTLSPFRSMAEIQENRGLINRVSKEDMDALKDELANKGFRLTEAMGYRDTYADMVLDGLRHPDPEVRNLAKELRDDLAKLPTEYFEGKPQRAVGLDEFKLAAVPESMPDVARSLDRMGLDVRSYDRSKMGEDGAPITEILRSRPDLLFSNDDQLSLPGIVMAGANAGLDMSHEARMKRAAEMGYDTSKTYYHGTNDAGFTEFNTKPSDPKTKDTGAWFTDSYAQARTYQKGRGALVEEPDWKHIYEEAEKAGDIERYEDGSFALWGPDGKNEYRDMADFQRGVREGEMTERAPGIYPVYLKRFDPETMTEVDMGGKNWDGTKDGKHYFDEDDSYSGMTTDQIARELIRDGGEQGVAFKNVLDEGPYGQGGSGDGNVRVVRRPQDIRHVDADFDPNKASSANIFSANPAEMSFPAFAEAMNQIIDGEGAETDFGTRPDGTRKGPGFLGELQRPDGGVSTELSIGVPIGGRETEIPLLVPTLSQQEIDWLLSQEDLDPQSVPKSIVDKAIEHAVQRLEQGLSPFAE